MSWWKQNGLMSDEAVSFTCFECSMFSVPLKVEDVKFKASIFLEVLKPPPTYQLAYDYNWSEIEGNSEDCIFRTKWKALLNSWRWFLFFFKRHFGWIQPFQYLVHELYPEAQLLVDDLLLHRRQGEVEHPAFGHVSTAGKMKHDLGLQHSGSKQRFTDFKEKFIRKCFLRMLEKYDLLSSIGGMLPTEADSFEKSHTSSCIVGKAGFVWSWHLEEVLLILQVHLMNHNDWIRWVGQMVIQDDVKLMKYPGILIDLVFRRKNPGWQDTQPVTSISY